MFRSLSVSPYVSLSPDSSAGEWHLLAGAETVSGSGQWKKWEDWASATRVRLAQGTSRVHCVDISQLATERLGSAKRKNGRCDA